MATSDASALKRDARLQDKYANLRGESVLVLGALEWRWPADGIDEWQLRQRVYLPFVSGGIEGYALPQDLEPVADHSELERLSSEALGLSTWLIRHHAQARPLVGASVPAIYQRAEFERELNEICHWGAVIHHPLDPNQKREGWKWAFAHAVTWKRLRAARARSQDRPLSCPDNGFTTADFNSKPVKSVGAMVELGINMSNCLLTETEHYTRGSFANYELFEAGRFAGLYTLMRLFNGIWKLKESGRSHGRPMTAKQLEFIQGHICWPGVLHSDAIPLDQIADLVFD